MAQSPCARCSQPTAEHLRIETGMRIALQELDQGGGLPDQVCPLCYAELAKFVPQGAKLRFEKKARAANKTNMWQKRVELVRAGHDHMSRKNFAEAAMSYEKYLRVLEFVYDCKTGELKPDMFRNSSRQKEITVVTSVYWDLVRIYDGHPAHHARQELAAAKLVEFARFTRLFGDIMRKTESFAKTAKNPEIFKSIIQQSTAKRPRCFIATAAFAAQAPEVQVLCHFREQVLRPSALGRKFILYYYRISPAIARHLDQVPRAKPLFRLVLRPFVCGAEKILQLKSGHEIRNENRK